MSFCSQDESVRFPSISYSIPSSKGTRVIYSLMGCGASASRGARRDLVFLPDDDPDAGNRAKEIVETKTKNYNWQYAIPDIPPCLPEVPPTEICNATSDRKLHLFASVQALKISLPFRRALDFFQDVFRTERPFEDFDDIFDGEKLKKPSVAKRWQQDEEFARQRLVGCNPTLIRCLNTVKLDPLPPNEAEFVSCMTPAKQLLPFMPPKFPVTEADVKGVLPEGFTLAQLFAENRLFIVDYEPLQEIIPECPPERFTTAPIALFFADPRRNNRLMPVAIQLDQFPSRSLIFTPMDPHGIWLIAKIHVQVADANLHEVEAHLLATHIILEAVYVSMRRNLHTRHPLATWLQENFFYTLHINDGARKRLIAPEGAVPTLLSLGYTGVVALFRKTAKNWDFNRYDIPKNFARRGIMDKLLLPENYYRDDALRVWALVEHFVSDMVDIIYRTDASVKNDVEVRNWIQELMKPLGSSGCGFRGIPCDEGTSVMSTKAQLKLFLTMVIYTASAGHSAVNNGQYEYLAYVPNSPGTFAIAPPKTKDKDVSIADIARALPHGDKTQMQITFVYLLSTETDDPLGSYDGPMFRRPDFAAAVEAFQTKLIGLSDDIRKRNEKLECPYTFLDPRQVAQGIAI